MNKFKILIVDDEESQRLPIKGFLEKKGYSVFDFQDVDSAMSFFKQNQIDLIITDLRMPGKTGKEMLEESKQSNPEIPVIITSAFGELDEAVKLMKFGAFDFLQKPIELIDLLDLIKKAENRADIRKDNDDFFTNINESSVPVSFNAIITSGGEFDEILSIASRVAASKVSVLIRGESGTGKELIARAIHDASDRKSRPFVVVNCAAMPETLFESELFGHEKGSFTGAIKSRTGMFEQANGGTLFIDEVGDIPLAVQVKLLRALQFGEIQRLGGEQVIYTDVRIISATNRNLEEMIFNKDFREDLLYRLNVVTITLPPLRQRKFDIKPLIEHFIEKHSEQNNRRIDGIEKDAFDMLMKYDFPGNVRELENIIQRAVVLARKNTISIDDLPKDVLNTQKTKLFAKNEGDCFDVGDLNLIVENIEKELINKALSASSGNQVKAATMLNISERTLRYKLKKLGID